MWDGARCRRAGVSLSVLGSWTGARRRRSEDWGVTSITDQIAAWPGLGCGPDPLADFGRECQHGNLRRACNVCEVLAERTALESRLRDTAAALRPFVDLLQHHNDRADRDDSTPVFAIDRAIITLGDLRKGRAILARLKQEGLA